MAIRPGQTNDPNTQPPPTTTSGTPGTQTIPAPTSAASGSFVMTPELMKEMFMLVNQPSPAQQKKEAEQLAKELRQRERRRRIAVMEEAAKIQRQKLCRHRKPNNEETSGGQTFSDGRVRVFCLRCQAILREYWSPEIAQGMAIAKKLQAAGISEPTQAEIREAMEIRGEGYGGNGNGSEEADEVGLMMPRSGFAPDQTTLSR